MCRKVLRRMGKRRLPSEDEQAMYRRWSRDWGFSDDAILDACAETTKGDPSFSYLDGILGGMKKRNQGKGMRSAQEVEAARSANAERIAPLKALLNTMNTGATVNEGTLALYDEMRALYTDDVILLAGRECARAGKGIDDVQLMLRSWKQKGIRNIAEAQDYVMKFKASNDLLQVLYEAWGKRGKPTAADRTLVQKWMGDMQMTDEMILHCGALSGKAENPVPYLDKMLTSLHEQGIHTPAQLEASRAAYQAQQEKGKESTKPAGKVVREQQYEQREYEATQGMTEKMAKRLKELKSNA